MSVFYQCISKRLLPFLSFFVWLGRKSFLTYQQKIGFIQIKYKQFFSFLETITHRTCHNHYILQFLQKFNIYIYIVQGYDYQLILKFNKDFFISVLSPLNSFEKEANQYKRQKDLINKFIIKAEVILDRTFKTVFIHLFFLVF